MIGNAKSPENLRIGIARQFHPEDKFDDLTEYENDDRFRILNIPHEESTGVCWARNQVQQLYKNEEYTLQIDSHMRFEKNWDETLINMIKELQEKGYKKPLLTGYVSSFDPENDPEYYFHGEEISVGVRAYTHGYDLFHPHKVIIWHEYTRKGRTKQWDDDKEWYLKNSSSHSKNRKILRIDGESFDGDLGKYGFGTERTLKDYEKYAGVMFSKRSIQQYTIDKKYPPNPYDFNDEEEWEKSFLQIFKHCIDLPLNKVPENDYEFFVVAFHNKSDETLFRQDADVNEIIRIKNDSDGYGIIWREFNTQEKPTYWVVWPFSKSKGWCERITGNL
jgi:hypothetical protein